MALINIVSCSTFAHLKPCFKIWRLSNHCIGHIHMSVVSLDILLQFYEAINLLEDPSLLVNISAHPIIALSCKERVSSFEDEIVWLNKSVKTAQTAAPVVILKIQSSKRLSSLTHALLLDIHLSDAQFIHIRAHLNPGFSLCDTSKRILRCSSHRHLWLFISKYLRCLWSDWNNSFFFYTLIIHVCIRVFHDLKAT